MKVMTAESPNHVEIHTPTTTLVTVTLDHPGDFSSSFTNQPLVILSERPILVAQFGGFADVSDALPGSGPRAMLVVPPAELYRSRYTLSTAGHSDFHHFQHYLVVVSRRSAVDRLRLDDQPISGGDWVTLDSATAGRLVPVSPGVHVIVHLDGTPFGAYVYGHSDSNCAYAYAAGLCLESTSNRQVGYDISDR